MEEKPKFMQQTETKTTIKWQNRLLPWFIAMPTLLIAAFIFLATQQMIRFNEQLQTAPDSVLIGKIIPSPNSTSTNPILRDNLNYIKWVTLARLEQESYYRRYNQGGMLLMSRIFTKYLGFFTGMILAIVGSVFIIGKISEASTNLEGSVTEQAKFKLISSSPGIVFATLGTILMLSAILKHNDVMVTDSPLYLNPNTIISVEGIAQPSGLINIPEDSTEIKRQELIRKIKKAREKEKLGDKKTNQE